MQYSYVMADSLAYLKAQITTSIANGWEPLGGISVFRDYNNKLLFCQAIIKDKITQVEVQGGL